VRIGTELPRYLQDGRAPFDTWHNGAYVLESFPCAPWCFLASPEDFEQTLFTAVDAGHDADTVATIACTLSGAYHGYSRLPQRFLDDLEYHDRLIELAIDLYDLNRRLRGVELIEPKHFSCTTEAQRTQRKDSFIQELKQRARITPGIFQGTPDRCNSLTYLPL
jgi:hypothetical protein